MLGGGAAAGEGGAGEPCETGADLYFGMITPQSEIKALVEECQVCSLSIHPPQGPRAVLPSVPDHVLAEALALTDPQEKIHIPSKQDWLHLGTHNQHNLQSVSTARIAGDKGDAEAQQSLHPIEGAPLCPAKYAERCCFLSGRMESSPLC